VKLGAEPKKVVALGGLLAIAAIALYMNSSSDDSPSPAPRPAPTSVVATPPARPGSPNVVRHRTAGKVAPGEFKPRIGPKNPEDRPDPSTIDPELRLDLLAKVQKQELGPTGRNIFQFGAAPPPPAAKIEVPKNVPKIAVNNPPVTAPPPPPGPPPAPVAPPMTFKYYGYQVSKTDGHKAAFLLDGEEILIAGENDTMKRRYKVVKIGVSSITIEDTQFKSTQTLPLQENNLGA